MEKYPAYFRTKKRLKDLLKNAPCSLHLDNALLSLVDQHVFFGNFDLEIMMGFIFASLTPSPLLNTKYDGYQLRTTDSIAWWSASVTSRHKDRNRKHIFAMEAEKGDKKGNGTAWIHLFRIEYNELNSDTIILSSMPLCRMCSARRVLNYAPYKCCRHANYCSQECQALDYAHGHFTSHLM